MGEAPEEREGRGWRPTVPTAVVVVSVLVALVAVSALLVVLFKRTTGPGEILRDFSRLLAAEDCPGSYELLDPLVQRRVGEEDWCGAVPALREELGPGFQIERVVLEGDVARVEVSGDQTVEAAWSLAREDRSWRVLGASDPVDFPGGLPQ